MVALNKLTEGVSDETAYQTIAQLLSDLTGTNEAGYLTTADLNGKPHVIRTYARMDAQAGELLTVIPADDLSVTHVQRNALVEWMFPQIGTAAVIYLTGTCWLIEDHQEAAKILDRLEGPRPEQPVAILRTRLDPVVKYRWDGDREKEWDLSVCRGLPHEVQNELAKRLPILRRPRVSPVAV